MAPLNFSDNIGLFSLLGTWVGAIFTLVGLLAVFTQLKSLLREFSEDPTGRIQTAAGDWAICLPKPRRGEKGVLEGKAPSILAWIEHRYNSLGPAGNIIVTPYERTLSGGQASWSILFARLQIQPQELLSLGGPNAKRPARGTRTWQETPSQNDLLIDGPKISYGMTGVEFAALLILSGCSPSNFRSNETSDATSCIGHMYLAANDPFSQIAQMDTSSSKLSDLQGSDAVGRYAHCVNVKQCIELALGIFRFDNGAHSKLLVTCNIPNQGHLTPDAVASCFAVPSHERLLAVRRNVKRLCGSVTETEVVATEFRDIFVNSHRWKLVLPDSDLTKHNLETSMRIAVALSSLHPWGLPAVLPRSFADALCPILDKFLDKQKATPPTTPIMLTRKFRECSKHTAIDIPGWDRFSMDTGLESLQSIHSQAFTGQSSHCALYFDAMKDVFKQHNVDMRLVEIGLAAQCTSQYLECFHGVFSSMAAQTRDKFHENFRAATRERLNGSPSPEQEPWAYEILATYMHSWLKDSIPIEEDFRKNFRRRVFLG